jgi:small multidrug resistance pump
MAWLLLIGAIASGVGTAAIALIGALFLDEPLTGYKIAGIVLVIAGVVVLNLSSSHS